MRRLWMIAVKTEGSGRETSSAVGRGGPRGDESGQTDGGKGGCDKYDPQKKTWGHKNKRKMRRVRKEGDDVGERERERRELDGYSKQREMLFCSLMA